MLDTSRMHTRTVPVPALARAFMGLCLVIATAQSANAAATYLALGDSITFGLDPSTPSSLVPSNADQGFVKPFANSLVAVNGGVRPDVRNLAISGELSTTYFDATPPIGWTNRVWQLNTAYPNGTTPQSNLAMATLQAQAVAGSPVKFASLEFGSNDFLYLLSTPSFINGTPSEQQNLVANLFGVVVENYYAALTQLRSLAPSALVVLPGYYNPFPSFAPQFDLYDQVVRGMNTQISSLAPAFNAIYVDIYSPISSREFQLTNIGSGDFHPNQDGYAVIAAAMTRAVVPVPEPATIGTMAVGLTSIILVRWGRRKPAAR